MTRRSTRQRMWTVLVLCGGMSLAGFGGCAAAEEFRAVAGDSLKTGLTSIATGLIDGLFAVFEPDDATGN